jgi:Tfp pilus assembly pilus retraction ATPase PilT
MLLSNIPSLFQQKCLIKNIAFEGAASFFVERRLEQVKMQWKSSLGTHLRELPDIERVLGELRNTLEQIFS